MEFDEYLVRKLGGKSNPEPPESRDLGRLYLWLGRALKKRLNPFSGAIVLILDETEL